MKIGISSCGKPLCRELFAEYRAAGVDCIEISEGYSAQDSISFPDLKNWSEEYGVEIWSYHLPFAPFGILEPSVKELAPKTVSYFGEIMGRASEIGIGKFIVHPSGEPIDPSDRTMRIEVAKESLCSLAEIAKGYGVTVAVENLPRTCLGKDSSEMLELVSVHPQLGVCFDTNHLLGEDFETFINKVGKRIVTTHISDYDFVDERHWMPGEGRLDWQSLYSALNRAGYSGAWMYELGYLAPKTLLRSRPLYALDFVRNAEAIFGGKEIPRVI